MWFKKRDKKNDDLLPDLPPLPPLPPLEDAEKAHAMAETAYAATPKLKKEQQRRTDLFVETIMKAIAERGAP